MLTEYVPADHAAYAILCQPRLQLERRVVVHYTLDSSRCTGLQNVSSAQPVSIADNGLTIFASLLMWHAPRLHGRAVSQLDHALSNFREYQNGLGNDIINVSTTTLPYCNRPSGGPSYKGR